MRPATVAATHIYSQSGPVLTIAGATMDNRVEDIAFSLPHDFTRCHNCGGDTRHKLKRCSGCEMVLYCSKECQRKAWPAHK